MARAIGARERAQRALARPQHLRWWTTLTQAISLLDEDERAWVVPVRINCIGLVGLHHLFYKRAAGPLGFQGVRHPWCHLPWSRS
jgi:hypothetical protein